jgi:hypothetical protein
MGRKQTSQGDKILGAGDLEEVCAAFWWCDGLSPRVKVEGPKTLHLRREEIAQELGVTRERVRQIERRALEKCRVWCDRRGYRLEDLLFR